MVNVVITGIAGRMGGELLRAFRADPRSRVVAGTVRPGAPTAEAAARLGLPVDDRLGEAIARGAEVVVDFTSPQATAAHVEVCASAGAALVIGTTGLSPREHEAIEGASRRIPVVFAPNMSVGMNLLFRLVEEAAGALPGFDTEVVEIHHRHKKDSPSGSALRLARAIAQGRGGAGEVVHGRRGQVGARPAGEIGMHALRGGEVAGDHTVFLLGPGERLELTHRASSREAFAAGAVRAALWVKGRPAGLYSMQDVLAGA
ncbi:MAG TPA: 4-hydroxy-tetrahydrodipicolinate reductase [Vulgatibacter sp.]|nr:4-hydroxy-tetrahydrodipicolinate reductase [Vulgatibacter sp.]